MTALRRSMRSASAGYDSNGRDYLASMLGWSREQLEDWLKSESVRPHLTMWYQLCVVGGQRFNDGVEWINTGDNGYYYNAGDLEEDLLLMCLCEGNAEARDENKPSIFAKEQVQTSSWMTQEIWARTVWRIVQDNKNHGELFHTAVTDHPAKAYGFVIDILCLAFHSLAYRQANSVWKGIINGDMIPLPPTPQSMSSISGADPVAAAVALDQDPSHSDDAMTRLNDSSSTASLEATTIIDKDDDFEDPSTPIKKPMYVSPPKAPSKFRYGAEKVDKEQDPASASVSVKRWLQGLEPTPCPYDGNRVEHSMTLQLASQNGTLMARHHKASAIFLENDAAVEAQIQRELENAMMA